MGSILGWALELWPRDMSACEEKIQPLFNRLAIFRTTDFSYHGYTDLFDLLTPVNVSMYYYTNEEDQMTKNRPIRWCTHGTLWQKVRCAMQSGDAIYPACKGALD